MQKLLSFGLIIIFISCKGGFYIENPYKYEHQYQYKVNLHAHSTERSESYAYSPKDLLLSAKKYGYVAFAITDLPDAGGIVADPGIEGIIHIPGVEYGGKPHLIGLGIKNYTESDDKQEQIEHIKKQGGFAYIPHPHWGEYDEELISKYFNIDGVAIYNSLTYGVAVSENKDSLVIPYNEKLIDKVLSKGIEIAIISEEDTKYEDPHVYGHQLNTAWINIWSNLLLDHLNVENIIESLKEKKFTSHGRFLRSSPEPPEFIEISTNNMQIKVKVNKNCNIEFITSGGIVQKVFKNNKSGFYKLSPEDKYVRIKATFIENESSSWAWTNPIYIKRR